MVNGMSRANLSVTNDQKPVMSLPNVLLRIEGLALFVGGILLFAHAGGAWWVFLLFLLAPDLAMLPYMISLRAGAIAYNIIHTFALPLVLLFVALSVSDAVLVQVAAIWIAHIGMDRVVGYGLKYATGFKDTHMQRV